MELVSDQTNGNQKNLASVLFKNTLSNPTKVRLQWNWLTCR